jgi:hydrogenase nickel incorporation protein HypB
MCDTCGCGETGDITISKLGDPKHKHTVEHTHEHEHNEIKHTHAHIHPHDLKHSHQDDDHQLNNHTHEKTIELQKDILSKNNLIAERNRGYFEAKKIFALNLVSSPGSGKTSLLEKTISAFKGEIKISVIEGDQQTAIDAERINSAGAPVIQINTGNGCHLDSEMINRTLKELNVEDNSILMIENVGNLVCPSLFDLGESKRVLIMSVTEGIDKPLKYPTMFQSAHLCIINKIDLLPYVDFDIEKTKEYALMVNHHLEFIQLSVSTGEGMNLWYDWLKREKQQV